MRRREFLRILSGAAAAWPLAAAAQDAGRKYRIAYLGPNPRTAATFNAFFDALAQFGFVEGRNLTIDTRIYGQQIEQLPRYAEELFSIPADVIIALGDPAIRIALQATKNTPILALTDDMVKSGFVTSLARPSANMTGVSLLATELDGKRQDILIEAVPGLRHMAALADTNTTAPQQLEALQAAARSRGIELSVHGVGTAGEIAGAIDAAKNAGAGAINVLASPLLFANRQTIIGRNAALNLPAIYQWPEMAEEGGFLGYGPRFTVLYRDIMARQLARLLRGTMPADIPVEQPANFELVINLKTAKAIGHEIPANLVLRADKLVE